MTRLTCVVALLEHRPVVQALGFIQFNANPLTGSEVDSSNILGCAPCAAPAHTLAYSNLSNSNVSHGAPPRRLGSLSSDSFATMPSMAATSQGQHRSACGSNDK